MKSASASSNCAQGKQSAHVVAPNQSSSSGETLRPLGLQNWTRHILEFVPLWLVLAALAGWFAYGCGSPGNCSGGQINGPATVAVGKQVSLTLIDGCKSSVTQATWSASPSGYLSVNSKGNVTGLSATPAGVTVAVTAKSTSDVGGNGTAQLTVTGPTLQSIAVTDADKGVAAVSQSDQFTATGTYSDSTTQNLTSYVTWASSLASVSTIQTGGSSGSGLAATLAPGDTLISASVTIGSAPAISGTEMLTVGTLQTITVTDADNGTAPTASTDQFTATGTYAGGATQDLTTFVTWSSGNTASVSFGGNNGATPAGDATTGIAGSALITASVIVGGVPPVTVSGTETVTVSNSGPTLTSIAVTPATASVAAGLTQQYVATGAYSDGSHKTITSQVTWAAAPTSTATISAGGLAKGVAAGPATITASLGPITSPGVILTVTAAILQSITVTPTTASIQVSNTQTYTATGHYSDGSNQPITTGLTWASVPTSVATITSGGVATGVSAGTATITAAVGTLGSSPVTLTVNAQQGNVPRYLFEVNGDNTISDYAVLPSTGQLRAVSYFGIPGQSVEGAALNPASPLPVMYLVQSNPSTGATQLSTFQVTDWGQISYAGAITANLSGALAVDPKGRYLYGTDGTDQQIALFTLDTTSGLPTAGTGLPLTVTATELTIDPAGTFLFMEDNGGSIHSYQIGPGGALTAVGTPPSSHPLFGRQEIAVDPSDSFLLAVDAGSQSFMYIYSISAGALTPVAGSPFPIGSFGGNISQFVFDPAAGFLYAIDDANDQLLGFVSNGSGLTPITGSPFASPASGTPAKISVDPSGKFVFVSYEPTGELWTYSIASGGSSPGALTLVSKMRLHSSVALGQMLSAGTAAVTFTPTALFVTNASTPGATITQFTIDPATGNLSNLSTPIGAGNEAKAVATDPFGVYAYDAAYDSNAVFGYSISNTGLSLLPTEPYAAGNGPSWLTTDLSGSFLYATMQTDNTVWKYDLVSGVPTSGASAISTHAGPVFVTTDPTGSFIYVADTTAATIDVFSINLPQGGLGPIAGGSVAHGTSQNWIAIDPSGRFAYSADPLSNAVWQFTIGTTGALTLNSNPYLPAGPSTSTPGAGSVAIDPTGKFLYATNVSLGQIYLFTIDPSTGLLSPVHTSMSGGEAADPGPLPGELAVDISGKYLYCVTTPTAGSGTISIYKIDPSTGLLTSVGAVTNVPFAAGFTTTGTLQ